MWLYIQIDLGKKVSEKKHLDLHQVKNYQVEYLNINAF